MSGAAQSISTSTHEERSRSDLRTSGDQSSRTVTLHGHGSCSECHHFHRHVAFEAPIDDTEPTRFHCERCRHPMFGLGRTDTQITLASQDSFPLVDGAVDRSSLVECCENRPDSQPALRVITPVGPSTRPLNFEQLSAIEEQTSPAVPSATVTTIQELPSTLSRRASLGSREQIVSPTSKTGNKASTSGRGPDVSGHRPPRSSRALKYVNKLLGRLAKRICGRSRQYRFFGFGLSFHLTSDYLGELEPSNQSSAQSNTGNAVSSVADQDIPPRVVEAQRPSGETDDVRHVGNSRPTGQPLQEHTVNENTRDRTQNRDLNAKDEKLRNHRRDQTLRKQALRKRCSCTQDCQCKMKCSGSSSVALSGFSDSISARRRGSDLSLDLVNGQIYDNLATLPSPYFEGIPSSSDFRNLPFNHLGSLFTNRRGSPRDNSSSSSNTNRRRRRHDLTTESNASSVSLHPSRPNLPRRSLSSSVLSPSPTPSRYDSIVADVFQNLQFIQRTRSSAVRPGALSWRHNGEMGTNLDIDSSEQVDGDLPSQLNTSMTVEHQDTDSQEDQPNIDGEGMPPDQSQDRSLADWHSQSFPELPDSIQVDGASTQAE